MKTLETIRALPPTLWVLAGMVRMYTDREY